MRTLVRSLIFASMLVAPVAEAADALRIDLVPKAQKGQGQPELVVHAEVGLKRLVLEVVRSTDGKKLRLQSGAVAAGRVHRFALEIPKPGSATFEGKLTVDTESGEKGEMPISVNAELLDPIEVTVKADDVDLAKKELKVAASREVKRIEISCMSDTGTPLCQSVTEDPKSEDGKWLASWEQGKGTVLRVSVRAVDASGFFGGVDLFPWKVDIPHEEVNFKSGSFDIDGPEAPKLEASFKQIEGAIQKYGKLATIKLFIAGHTDTVGDNASNLRLSNDRARSIGRWFRKRGVKISVLYAGFGEELLAVQTPDETDEVKNRRAEYIVAVEAPPMRGGARFVPLD